MADGTGRRGTPRVGMDDARRGPGWGPSKEQRYHRLSGAAAQKARKANTGHIVLPLVEEVLRAQHARPDTSRRVDVLHPSSMAHATWCPRAEYFRLETHRTGGAPLPEKFSFVRNNVFAEGHAIHAKWQDWLARSGKLWGDWYCDRCMATVRRTDNPDEGLRTCGGAWTKHKWEYREVTLWDNEVNIHGHEDGALLDHRALVEIKSVGLGSLRYSAPEYLARYYHRDLKQYDIEGAWKDLHTPLPDHVRQVNIYMWLARSMGLPFDKTAVLYESKMNQQVKEFLVPFDEKIVDPLITWARVIADARITKTPPSCAHGRVCKECEPYAQAAVGKVRKPVRPADPVHGSAAGDVGPAGHGDERPGVQHEPVVPHLGNGQAAGPVEGNQTGDIR